MALLAAVLACGLVAVLAGVLVAVKACIGADHMKDSLGGMCGEDVVERNQP